MPRLIFLVTLTGCGGVRDSAPPEAPRRRAEVATTPSAPTFEVDAGTGSDTAPSRPRIRIPVVARLHPPLPCVRQTREFALGPDKAVSVTSCVPVDAGTDAASLE